MEKEIVNKNDSKEKEKSSSKITNKIFNTLVTIFMSLMVILVFINAIMRYALKTTIPVTEEYARFLFMWTVFFGVIAGFKDGEHVAVTVLTERLKGKSKIVVYILAQVFTILAMVLVLVGGIKYTISTSTYKTVATGINSGIVVSGFVIMIVGSLIVIVKDGYKGLQEMIKTNKEEVEQ